MHPIVVVVVIFIIPRVENVPKSEIVCVYYKRRCLSVTSLQETLKEQSSPDLLTCSLRCLGDHNCCNFFYNISNSTCVLQGDVLTRQPSRKCYRSGVWYTEKKVGGTKTCLEGYSERYEANTKPTTQHQVARITQTKAPAPFEHIQNMTLHQACEEGRLEEVRYILSTGLKDINCQNKKGFTPVMSAAWKGQEAVFDFLVKRGCDLSLVTNINNNVLHAACDGGNTDIVMDLLDKHKLDIDCRGCTGWTPVMFAAFCGNREIVKLLAHKGCNLTVVDNRKNNLLHIGSLGGYVDVVKYIITQNIFSIESRGDFGQTPALTAAGNGHVAVVKLLESKGCNLRGIDDLKRNILHVACLGGHLDMVKYIIKESTVGIDSRDGMGQTPVMLASISGHMEVVKLLVSNGCAVRVTDNLKRNILHVACLGGHVEMIKHILKTNIVGIDSRDSVGQTPVMTAAGLGHTGAVDLLINEGCNQRIVDGRKDNLLHVACQGGNVDVVKYIIAKNIHSLESRGNHGRTPVLTAAGMGHIAVFDLLKMKGCNLRAVSGAGNNILHDACLGGHVDMVQHILKLNILNIESRGIYGRTPMLLAAEAGHVRVVDLLRREGCNMRVADNSKNNILFVSCLGGHVEMVKYVIKLKHVGKESRGYNGETAVMVAARKGHVGVVDLLMKEGCDMKVVDNDRNTILHVACIGGHIKMVKFLLRLNIVSRRSVNVYRQTPLKVAMYRGHSKIVTLFNAGK